MSEGILQWPIVSAAFFVYVAVAALLLPRLPRGARMRAASLATTGLAVSLSAIALGHRAFLHDWLLPPVLLLLSYWSTGALVVAPMPKAEAALRRIDSALGVRQISARTPRPIAELLELSYLGVYPLIPIALLLHLWLTPRPDAQAFWSVVLLTDYICFGTLPWLQTRPPRTIEGVAPWRTRLRAVNVATLDTASVHANTFPSGHAAEAMAAALLVIGAPMPVVVFMFIAAALVSAGAVLGRYHYALDALAGWAVAAGVWWAVV